ncbi:MAG: hypothetical protein WBX15_19640 [Thermoanaerobaculia bacterium]
MNLESQLKQLLKRTDPPAGFEERVMERIRRGDASATPKRAARWQQPWRAAVAALLLLVAGGSSVALFETHQHRLAGERAKEEVLLALRITGEKSALARHQIEVITGDAENAPGQ